MGGNTGTGGTTTSYRPCPTDGSPCKIMPLGDSITYGYAPETKSGGAGGYRSLLFALAVAAGKNITFTGSKTDGGPTTVSGKSFPQHHEGHSGCGIAETISWCSDGSTVPGINAYIPSPGFSSGSGGTPNIILLHIGTNDCGAYQAAQMLSSLKTLLTNLVTSAPNALVVVAQIIPENPGASGAEGNYDSVIQTYNAGIPALVQGLGSDKHIVVLDMYDDFNTSTMLINSGATADNAHPDTTGYQYMADKWYSVIGSLLP